MSVIHCLMWIKDSMVSTIIYNQSGIKYDVLKIGEREETQLDEKYWSKLKEYIGMCSDDKIDLCLIYDEMPVLNETIISNCCESCQCVWSRTKIEEALSLLKIQNAVEIRNEDGILLLTVGCSLNFRKDKITVMTAKYTLPDEEVIIKGNESVKTTPFLEYYSKKLEEYKEGYEK